MNVNSIFINRDREIDIAAGLADALRGGARLRYPVVYFYGAPMIGKSALLREIRTRATVENGWGVHVAYLDWNDTETQQRWANQLCQQVYAAYHRVNQIIDSRRQPNDSDDIETAWTKTLDLVKTLPAYAGPFLWLLDTIEKIPPETWQRLQTGLLGLLETQRVGLILAGRLSPDGLEESRLLSFEYAFARLIERVEITPLDERQTQKHLDALSYHAPESAEGAQPEFVYLQTGGVPGLNEAFVKEQGDLQRAIQHGLLPHIRAGYRESPPESNQNVWELTRQLAVYRTFDAEIVAGLTDTSQDSNSIAYLQSGWHTLEILLAQHYIEKLPVGSGYRVVQALRPAILATHTPDELHTLHRAAIEQYPKRIDKGDYDAAIDWLSHSIGAAEVPLSRAELQSKLESIFKKMHLPQTQTRWLEKARAALRQETQDWERLDTQAARNLDEILQNHLTQSRAAAETPAAR